MNDTKDFLSGSTPVAIVPLWKTLALMTTLLVAAVVILVGNAYIGGMIFIAAIFMQAYGGFTATRRIEGETRSRITGFVIAWTLCTLLAVGLQAAIPAFDSVLQSFGADLPRPTLIVQKIYPVALVGPLLVGMVWHFWPNRPKRLRAGAVLCWLLITLMLAMFACMYLPLWALG